MRPASGLTDTASRGFQVLASEGLVEILPNRGAVVSRSVRARRAPCSLALPALRHLQAIWRVAMPAIADLAALSAHA